MKKLITAAIVAASLMGSTAAVAQHYDRQHDRRYEQRHDDRNDRYLRDERRRTYERRYYSQQPTYWPRRCDLRRQEVVRDPYTHRRVCVDRNQHRSFLTFSFRL